MCIFIKFNPFVIQFTVYIDIVYRFSEFILGLPCNLPFGITKCIQNGRIEKGMKKKKQKLREHSIVSFVFIFMYHSFF